MANATNRPVIQTPKPHRDDLQRLIPDNVRLRRALEQMFTDVSTTIPDAVQAVGDAGQGLAEESARGGALDRQTIRAIDAIAAALSDIRVGTSHSVLRKLSELEAMIDSRQPVRVRVEQFIAPTLLNSWVNFGSGFNDAGFYKDPFGIVHLRGLIKNGTISAAAFTLPAGYRPIGKEVLSGYTNTGPGRFDVATNGDITPVSGGNGFFSLDGGTFRAA